MIVKWKEKDGVVQCKCGEYINFTLKDYFHDGPTEFWQKSCDTCGRTVIVWHCDVCGAYQCAAVTRKL